MVSLSFFPSIFFLYSRLSLLLHTFLLSSLASFVIINFFVLYLVSCSLFPHSYILLSPLSLTPLLRTFSLFPRFLSLISSSFYYFLFLLFSQSLHYGLFLYSSFSFLALFHLFLLILCLDGGAGGVPGSMCVGGRRLARLGVVAS